MVSNETLNNYRGARCKVCSKTEHELKNDLHFHHIVPRSIGGTDKDGRIYLCSKHHTILHFSLEKWIYRFVPNEKRKECHDFIKFMTNMWIHSQKRKEGIKD